MDLCEFEAGLVYKASTRTARTTTEKPCPKKTKNIKIHEIYLLSACLETGFLLSSAGCPGASFVHQAGLEFRDLPASAS